MLALGACAVPSLDRYLLKESETRPVLLEGARGPLTYKQSQAILEQLKKRSPETSIFDRHMAIEESIAGNFPLSIGNKVVLLEDGPPTYASMLAAIRAARHHVHMETYIFEADEVGKQFAEVLIERRKAGVQVRLIYDSVGSKNTPRDFFLGLAAQGIEVVEFNPINPVSVLKDGLRIDNRDHRKLTIVDGRVAFLGGINISDVYSRGSMAGAWGWGSFGGSGRTEKDDTPFEKRPWRDTHVRIEGPVVADFQRCFLEQWARQTKLAKLEGKEFFPDLKAEGLHVVRALPGSPDSGLNASYVTLISAIESAETQVHIMNAYFVPHQGLREALKDAARRGVDVSLILPSRTDSWLAFHAGRSFYEELLEAGVKIYERKTRLLHAKTACVDGVWSTVGSTNLDWRSLVHNYELNAIVLGPEFGTQMEASFAKDLANSQRVTLELWHARSISDRVREATARMWAYLL
ncbi:MAG TPA: phospholipase D-like domain-containing protein [Usitatibacter sp.]|nr:phospholipase D-like domain-containing protein [Usitatibacter sp.]